MKIKFDPFVAAILTVILLAFLFPFWGSKASPVPLTQIGSIGVSLIFFFYGLKLSPEKIKNGLKNWQLHLVVQTATFVIFPLIMIALAPFLDLVQMNQWFLALLFLGALPSTVSSSVVMVSIAKGNIPSAIFNASISGLIGIGITPLWMGLFMKQTGASYDLSAVYQKLLLEILIPVILGLILQKYLGKYAQKHTRALTLFDKSIILLIVYKSFAESFEMNLFSTVSTFDLLFIFAFIAVLFFGMYALIGWITRKLNFKIEDQITAQFCGTKKSLVHGTVFSKILFVGQPAGLILLPLMIFHAFQIFVVSILATKLAQRKID